MRLCIATPRVEKKIVSYIQATLQLMRSAIKTIGGVTFKKISFIHVVDCGAPDAPQRGSLESYTNTTEGSEVFYRCDPGLVPEGIMRTVCSRNGWSPNPADLNCNIGKL